MNMVSKIWNGALIAFGSLFALALFVGRFLGIVGVFGLLARLIGWYKSWIWVWVIFVIIGFVSAVLLEKIQKSSQ